MNLLSVSSNLTRRRRRLASQWEMLLLSAVAARPPGRRKRHRKTFVNTGCVCDLSNLCGRCRRKLGGAQLDKYLDAARRSRAPGSPRALIVNHGRTVNIPLEGGIYKGADGSRGNGRVPAVNKELTPGRRRPAQRGVCQHAGRHQSARKLA